MLMKLMIWMLTVGIVVLGTSVRSHSIAQGSMDAHKEEIDLTRAVIKVQKKQIIAKNMILNSTERKEFWAVYRDYQDKMEAVNMRRVKIITDYADSVKNSNLTDEKSQQMLDEYLSFERMRLITKQSFVDRFKKILPARKVARFFQIENKLEAIINFDLARQIPLVQ